jgi:hypothetical protein
MLRNLPVTTIFVSRSLPCHLLNLQFNTSAITASSIIKVFSSFVALIALVVITLSFTYHIASHSDNSVVENSDSPGGVFGYLNLLVSSIFSSSQQSKHSEMGSNDKQRHILATVEYSNADLERGPTEITLEKTLGKIVGKPSIFGNMYIYNIKWESKDHIQGGIGRLNDDVLAYLLTLLKKDTGNLVKEIEIDAGVSI